MKCEPTAPRRRWIRESFCHETQPLYWQAANIREYLGYSLQMLPNIGSFGKAVWAW
jgi:hypothetical protein